MAQCKACGVYRNTFICHCKECDAKRDKLIAMLTYDQKCRYCDTVIAEVKDGMVNHNDSYLVCDRCEDEVCSEHLHEHGDLRVCDDCVKVLLLEEISEVVPSLKELLEEDMKA